METVTIPVNPPRDLLRSMATRYDHSFYVSEQMTDAEIEALRADHPVMGGQYLTSRERESLMTRMSQLHEEVVGKGFYRYE